MRARRRSALVAVISALGALSFVAPAQAANPHPPFIPAGADWLTSVNYFRTMAGVGAVAEDAALSPGAYNHSCYMLLNDISLRALAPGEIAKGFDGACPLSAFAPLDPALDLAALETRLVVNGRRRQHGISAQMLTPIIELLCYASRQFSLWPGDVVLTGTPAGVGPLAPGDRIVAELEGLVRVQAEIV